LIYRFWQMKFWKTTVFINCFLIVKKIEEHLSKARKIWYAVPTRKQSKCNSRVNSFWLFQKYWPTTKFSALWKDVRPSTSLWFYIDRDIQASVEHSLTPKICYHPYCTTGFVVYQIRFKWSALYASKTQQNFFNHNFFKFSN